MWSPQQKKFSRLNHKTLHTQYNKHLNISFLLYIQYWWKRSYFGSGDIFSCFQILCGASDYNFMTMLLMKAIMLSFFTVLLKFYIK